MDHSYARPSIGLIGAGRVGSSLTLALHQAGYRIAAVASRAPEHAAEVATSVGAAHLPLVAVPRYAELVLLAVPDDAVTSLAQLLKDAGAWQPGQMVVHCSGALPAAALHPAAAAGAQVASFHPLAAFALRNLPLPTNVTFAVEAQGSLHTLLHRMATELGGRALDLRPEDKPLYHAAAVLASNYTVVLAALAARLLEHTGATSDEALQALLPLLETTMSNLRAQGLPDGLTGPLVRGDVGTVARHVAALEAHDPRLAEVYRVLGLAALPLTADRHPAAMLQQLAEALQPILSLTEG